MTDKITADDLMEKIIELKIQLDLNLIELPSKDNEDIIQYHAKELISTFQLLELNYPKEHKEFIQKNPKYKPLDVICKDNSKGLNHIIECITNNKEQTITSIVKKVQSNQFYQWVKKNLTQEVSEVCETQSDKSLYVHLSQFNLPQVKQEEMGDCIALAFTGILSEHADFFNNPNNSEALKQSKLRDLMTVNRKYINWDFKSLTIEDQTQKYSYRKNVYKPRGVAASKMIDSTYTDGKHLFAVLSTNNSDTSSQNAQAFEIYKTLQSNFERKSLNIENGVNLEPTVILFNNAFFCTENPEKVEHQIGTSKEKKQGYHFLNLRSKFDNLYENKLSKQALDKINGLTTLSMLGNNDISWPRFPHTFDICDLIYCNPITSGSDTLWLHTKFEQLKIYDNPEKSQKFFNFLLDYSLEIIDYLNQAKPNADEPILGNIKKSFERMVAGVTRNFNSYNLHRELNDKEIEKITLLNDKIMDFNINQPNQSIDPNLFSSLNSDAFKNKGKLNNDIIKKRKDKFHSIEKNEIENKNTIFDEVNKALAHGSDNIFHKLDKLSDVIYAHGKQGKSISISSYLNHILRNLEICEQHNLDYLNIPKNLNPNYNYINNFLRESSKARENFNYKVFIQESQNPQIAKALEESDYMICTFLRSFHTLEGRKSLIDEGGLLSCTEKLYQQIQSKLEILFDKNISDNDYNYTNKETPFSSIKRNQLGSYWNLEIKEAIKSNQFGNVIGLLHEYLNRIQEQFEQKEKVSGKSFSDLPKKILYAHEISKEEPLVNEAIKNIVIRYNELGKMFEEQNKNNKKYKPKNYIIKV